ncbi:MAG: lamin tail domain-containing protein, partial [Candidatus Marinimicrobia bacterium]|nr:lamin tail domain-containing protein [Candidatus Neomarinimicrobiota bacterium]MBT5070349.1 lamin tail domain-containing protein [Candidatus Neomarinimicrobiota bacterium]
MAVSFGQTTTLFFSEYAEGTSSNKYLEIYNGSNASVDLADYVIMGNYNGNPFSEAFTFAAGAMLAAGDVYVVASSDASDGIQALADELLGYADPWYTTSFNGDDVRALAHVSGADTTILDIIGTLDGDGDGVEGEGSEDDPGGGFDVAGTSAATKDYTL